MANYDRLVTPSKWSGEEERFAIRLKDIIEDIYRRLGSSKTHVTAELDVDFPPGGSCNMTVNGVQGKACAGCWMQLSGEAAYGLIVGNPVRQPDGSWTVTLHRTGGEETRVKGVLHFIFEKVPAIRQRGESE